MTTWPNPVLQRTAGRRCVYNPLVSGPPPLSLYLGGMKTSEILIGRWGKIVAGENVGWYVFVEDDTAGSTGGFYIYRCLKPSLKSLEGYDDWVEKKEQIAPFFGFAKWEIEWLEPAA